MSGIAIKERIVEARTNDHGSFVPTGELAIAKLKSNDQKAAEKRSLQKVETSIGRRYQGIRGYFRLSQISRVISMLSLYLDLDQYEIHHKQHLKRAKARLDRAEKLTRAAVYGEKLYGVRMWFFDAFMRLARRLIVGSSATKDATQQKQAVWLKEKLIGLGPTFIKIG